MADKYSTTRENLKSFYDKITMPGGYAFDHVQTIRKIDSYFNGKFESGSKDSAGFRKYFYNIVKPACEVATKFIDLDTKDVMILSEKPDDEYRVWLMQRDLKTWLKEQKIGELLNDIAFDFPKYGTVVIKQGKDNSWEKVNLENMRLDPTACEIDDSPFVYEIHLMSPREIDSMPWDKEQVAYLLAKKQPQYLIYECYEQNTDSTGKEWLRAFKADFLDTRTSAGSQVRTAEAQINLNDSYLPGVTLYEDEVDELPYRELHWEKVPGRWLGMGFVEYLFDNQVRMNELVNIKARGIYFTSLKVYQTGDETVGRNLLTDVENGDIIKTQGDIRPVVNEERNLSVFNQEEARWDRNTEQKTFSFDIARGGDLPSQTPLGVARLSAGMIASYFELKRENFGLFFKDVILNDVIPQFKKQNWKKHLLKFLGSDSEINILHRVITEAQVRNAVVKHVLDNGAVPTADEIARERTAFETQIKKQKDFYINVPDGFYDDAEYSIDILITGEQMDAGARIQTLQTALQIIGTNPALLQDKATRGVFFKLLEMVGVSPIELNLMEDNISQVQAQQAQQAQQAPQQQPPAQPNQAVLQQMIQQMGQKNGTPVAKAPQFQPAMQGTNVQGL